MRPCWQAALPDMKKHILEISNLCFSWPGATEYLLKNLDLQLEPGEHIGIRGANGSGKTTLFRCITGLETIQSGSITLESDLIKTEKDFRSLRKRVGFCLQNAEDQLIFPTVSEDVSFGPLNLGLNQEEVEERVGKTLEKLGMAGYASRNSYELSGGEQKMIALASVLAMQPEVLLLDEPLNALDTDVSARIIRLFADMDCAIIAVSHEYEFMSRVCGKIFELHNGQLFLT